MCVSYIKSLENIFFFLYSLVTVFIFLFLKFRIYGDAVPKFQVGEEVRIKDVYFEGHHRTTDYVKGKSGRIIRYFGSYANPEILAYGGDGKPFQDLYWVQFTLKDLWEENIGTEEDKVKIKELRKLGAHNSGKTEDKLNLEIYEHWIETL